MYLLKISSSTFTRSLLFKFFKFVSLRVWGITLISKLSFLTFEIVKETPFIEIDAFSIKNLFNFLLSNSNLIIQDLSIILIFFTFAVVST